MARHRVGTLPPTHGGGCQPQSGRQHAVAGLLQVTTYSQALLGKESNKARTPDICITSRDACRAPRLAATALHKPHAQETCRHANGTEVKCKDPSDSFYQAAADPLVAVPSLQPRPCNSAQPHLGSPAARSADRNGADGCGDGIASSGPAAGARAGSTGASTPTSMASCTSL